jgi:hypothetical protein
VVGQWRKYKNAEVKPKNPWIFNLIKLCFEFAGKFEKFREH